MKKPVIFTIGHSTRPVEDFVRLLRRHDVREVVDVRTIPRSRHNPQFDGATLKESLRDAHVWYRHLKKLGGLRRVKKDSMNLGWHNRSFRGFADHMATEEFSEGLAALERIARSRTTAVMCAEAVPWRCHRSLIADALIKKGWVVREITSGITAKSHRLTPFLKVKKGQIIYPTPKTRSL